jgi:O-antigen/teichoic acid export membrane protein
MLLREKIILAFLWASSAKAISQGFSWLVTILLIRILTPGDFGLVAMASVFIGLIDLINEVGIEAAIVQKEDLDDEDLHSIFWVSIFSGVCFYIVAFFLAPILAAFVNNGELTNVLRILALTFIIGSFKCIPLSLVTKKLEFATRSIAESLSVIIGGGASIALALLGYGVWSLVYGALVRHLTLTVSAFYFAHWTPKLVFSATKVKGMLRFGISVVGSSVLWYFYSNFDSFIIGKLLGDKLLGYYSVAFNLSNGLIGRVMAVINQVSFPVCSKLQGDRNQLRLYFLKISRFISLITFPSMVGLFLVAEDFITVILTDKWLPILIPFRVLCLVAVMKSVDQIICTVLFATGQASIVLRYSSFCFLIFPISFVIGSNFGINGVAVALAIVHPLVSVFLFKHGLGELDISFYQYVRNLLPAILATAFMGVAVLGFQFGGQIFYSKSLYFPLMASCSLGVIAYLTGLGLFHRVVFTEVREIYYSLRLAR